MDFVKRMELKKGLKVLLWIFFWRWKITLLKTETFPTQTFASFSVTRNLLKCKYLKLDSKRILIKAQTIETIFRL